MQWIINGRAGTDYYMYASTRNKVRREYHKAAKYINKHRDLIKYMNFMNASLESDKNFSRLKIN